MGVVVPRVVAVDNVVTTGRRVVVEEAISVVVRSVTPGVEPVQTNDATCLYYCNFLSIMNGLCFVLLAYSGRVSWSSKQVLHDREVDLVLLQGGVTLFLGEFSTPTGWLDKPMNLRFMLR